MTDLLYDCDPDFMATLAAFRGTSEGARKAWETRRANAAALGPSSSEKLPLHQVAGKLADMPDAHLDAVAKHAGDILAAVEKERASRTSPAEAAPPSPAPAPSVKQVTTSQDPTLAAAKTGNKDAQAKVIADNQGMVHKLAKRYAGKHGNVDDLVQEGNIGLLKAMATHDPAKGSFSTHAFTHVRGTISKAANKAYKQVRAAGGEDNPDVADTHSTSHGASADVENMLSKLDKRSANVLKERYGIGGGAPKTADEVAKGMGLSRQRVQQLESAALKKLKSSAASFALLVQGVDPEFVAVFTELADSPN